MALRPGSREDSRARQKWYDGARQIADNWSLKYGKTRAQAAGILAVLSSQKDWFMNASPAERMLDILSTQMDRGIGRMLATQQRTGNISRELSGLYNPPMSKACLKMVRKMRFLSLCAERSFCNLHILGGHLCCTLKLNMKLQDVLFASAVAVALGTTAIAQDTPKPAEPLPDAPQATAAAMIQPNGPTVIMDTSMGRITCQFFKQQAPKAVANFIALAKGAKDWTNPASNKKEHNKPLYDGTIFHRVIPEFMIQGGDPAGTGAGDPGYSFEDEFNPNLNFDVPGRLAMANSGPDTNGSQFFITEVPTEHLNQHHTIFGQCDDSSIEVVKAIARVERDQNDKPVTPVVLKKVAIIPEGQVVPSSPTSAPAKTSAAPQP